MYAEKLRMRLFTGIDLPEHVRERLERLLALLRPTAHLKWSPLDNLHITTKFIGAWPDDKLELLKSSLGAVPKRPPVAIDLEGLGWFPNPHRPRVFWVGVHGGEPLSALAAAIDRALEPIGIAPETKPYAPHITLARVSAPAPLTAIQHAVANLESAHFGSFEADGFYLYLSHTSATGSVYTKLSEFAFSE
jgi:2'-5' RNA ligase